MEHIIKSRHERLLSLINADPSRSEELIIEVDLQPNVLHSLQSSIKNYILDCLFESYTDSIFNPDLSVEDLSHLYSEKIMGLPNRTPNGLLLPKRECSFSYNTVVKNTVRLASFLGLVDTCEAAYMPINVRLPWGDPSDQVAGRAYSSLKWHTDIWAGEWARSVMLHIPIFGDFEKNGIAFASPPDEFYPDYIRDIPDYAEGNNIAENRRQHNLSMRIGKAYLVDSFLLHKTLCGHPSFRGILSFPLRPKESLESDIYENHHRAHDFIPMDEWREFGTKRIVTTDKALEPYTGSDTPTIAYADSYNLLKIT